MRKMRRKTGNGGRKDHNLLQRIDDKCNVDVDDNVDRVTSFLPTDGQRSTQFRHWQNAQFGTCH